MWPRPEDYERFKNWEPVEDLPGCWREKPKDQQVRTPLSPERRKQVDEAIAKFQAESNALLAELRPKWAEEARMLAEHRERIAEGQRRVEARVAREFAEEAERARWEKLSLWQKFLEWWKSA